MKLDLQARPKDKPLLAVAIALSLLSVLLWSIFIRKASLSEFEKPGAIALRLFLSLSGIISSVAWLWADSKELLEPSYEDQNVEELIAPIIQEAEMKVRVAQESVFHVQETYEKAFADLMDDFEKANALKKPLGPGRMDWLGSEIITLLATKGMLCDFDSYQETPGKDFYWLQPRNPAKWPEIKRMEEEIALTLGCTSISLTPEQHLIRVEVSDPRIGGHSQKSLASTVRFAPVDLIDCLERSNHFGVFGDTGSGKSTFIANICKAASEYYGGEASVIVIDPKFPDNDWGFEPQYKGFQRIHDGSREHPDAYDGIAEMQRRCQQRFSEASVAKIKGQPLPERPLEIWVLDEVPSVISVAEEKGIKARVVRAIHYVTRLGRSARICFLLVGQSVKCSNYGFRTKDSLLNLSVFALRDLALPAAEEYLPTAAEKRAFRKAIAQRQQEASQEQNKGFYTFYRLPGGMGRLGELPPPPDFSLAVSAEVPTEVPTPASEVPPPVPGATGDADILMQQEFQPELEISDDLSKLLSLVGLAERDEKDLAMARDVVESLEIRKKKVTATAVIREVFPETFTQEGNKSARRFATAKERLRSAFAKWE